MGSNTDSDSNSDKTGLGVASAVIGFVCGSLLAVFKYNVGREIESSTVIANATSSKCTALTSIAAILGIIFNKLALWLDSSLGISIATYTFYHGISIMTDARVRCHVHRLRCTHTSMPRVILTYS
jgi:divalent metal cation (Fe/Co/Zn/Cd) transporter